MTDYKGILLFGAALGGGAAFDSQFVPEPEVVEEETVELPKPTIVGRLKPRSGQPVLLPRWMYQP